MDSEKKEANIKGDGSGEAADNIDNPVVELDGMVGESIGLKYGRTVNLGGYNNVVTYEVNLSGMVMENENITQALDRLWDVATEAVRKRFQKLQRQIRNDSDEDNKESY